MATQAKKKAPVKAGLKQKVWYIANESQELIDGDDYYPDSTLEKAVDNFEIMDTNKIIHIFEVKYLGKAQINVTIKK